jgi:hypothetical protein
MLEFDGMEVDELGDAIPMRARDNKHLLQYT